MNYQIEVKNLEVASPCGVFEKERLARVRLFISISILFRNVDEKFISSDKVPDYASVAFVVRETALKEYRLLEELALATADALKRRITGSYALRISVVKANPAMVSFIQSAGVTIEQEII